MNNSGTLVDRRLEAGHGDKVAIRCAGENVSYAQLHDHICRAGTALKELGVGREDRVLMVLDDTPTFPALFLGAMRSGAVPAPVSFLDTTDNFAHYARDSYAKVIVAEDALLERLPAGAIGRTQFESLMADAGGETSPADIHPDDMAFWLFSGGSTGFPKGVVHLHHDIPFTCETFAREILRITERDVTFSSTKLYHAYGLGNNLTFPYWVGATTVLRPGKPDPRGLLETAQANRPTLFFSVPTLYGAMVNLPDAAEHDLSSVRMCVSAAEPLAPEVFRRWQAAFGLEIIDGIGSTEMLHIYCSNRPGAAAPGTSGKPVPGYELLLLDEAGEPVAEGEVGNLHVRGDSSLALLLAPAREDQGRDQGRPVLHRRPLSGRRGRQLRLRGARRRHDQDRRAVGVADRDRERARRASAGARSGGGGCRRRLHHARQGIRHLPRRRGRRGVGRRVAGVVQEPAASLRVPALHHVRRRASEDADGQDPAVQAAGAGMIFTALPQEDFEGVEAALADAFRRSQEAAREGEPIVFVLSQEDLLGQRSVPGAILANALLSGMRTLAAEGHRANAVAVGTDADPEDLQHWIAQLEAGRGVAGELVRVHAAHVGKIQV